MNTRLSKLKTLLKKNQLDALIVSSVANIIYLTGFSGFSEIEREAYLLIGKTKQYLFTDGRYTEAVRNIPHFELIEITTVNPLKKIFLDICKKHNIQKLGIEENNLTVTEYKKIKKCFATLTNISLRELRIIKEENEINTIEKACRLGDETFKHILKKIKEGITEQEIAFEIEFFIKRNIADISFKPIVAFGKNSAIPHHQASNQRLASNGQFVLLDFGVKIDNYCSDMTRTVFFGKATNEQKKMYQTVLDAQQKAIEALTSDGGRPKRSGDHDSSEVDRIARDYIISQDYPSIPHSLGHGIGLEVHESPSISPKSKDILKPGMVFSVEPGIYLPNFGGVRIEDLAVLEKSGPRLLTKSPRKLIEL